MADKDVVDWDTSIGRYSEKALDDAIKATSLKPTFAKAWLVSSCQGSIGPPRFSTYPDAT